MFASIGLGIVVLAWISQLVALISKQNHRIQPLFVLLYALGVVLLVIDGFSAGLTTLAYLNLASLVCALLVFAFAIRRN